MKASEGRLGRVFVLRLEDGDSIPACIEEFAAERQIEAAHVTLVGGVGSGAVVSGPRDSHAMPPDPMLIPVDGAHEVIAAGILVPDEGGRPVLHIHGALGRSGQTLTGCLRPGIRTWLVAEAVVQEIVGVDATRRLDERSGFTLLDV